MAYIIKTQAQYIGVIINEVIDYDKINCIKLKIRGLQQRYNVEKDPNKRKRLQMEIKVCELKIEIAKIV